MKKLFVAVLALAALAACNKEEAPSYADSQAKTIEISILNLADETRAVGGDTAQGTEVLCAEATELLVLFADNGGVIKHADTLTGDGTTDDTHKGDAFDEYVKDETISSVDNENESQTTTRRWHNVPAEVKQIAVVRLENGDVEGYVEGTPSSLVDKNISVLAAAAKDVKNINRPISTMILYGVGKLSDTGLTHQVDQSLFHVWKAEVTVAPAFARFEIHSIECTDLGANNKSGVATSYDFDELKINGLTWTYNVDGAAETHTVDPSFATTLYGSYDPADGFVYKYDQNTLAEGATRDAIHTPTNGAWSWNVLPGEFQQLVVDIDAYAYNYQIVYGGDETLRDFPLTVTGLSTVAGGTTPDGNVFEAGNIYTIDLIFTQSNIKTEDGICVEVVVTVNPWEVVERHPIYQ